MIKSEFDNFDGDIHKKGTDEGSHCEVSSPSIELLVVLSTHEYTHLR